MFCVTNDTPETSIKDRSIYHHTTPCETVIWDSDGVTGDCVSHWWKQY
jgi:hypothetical protein